MNSEYLFPVIGVAMFLDGAALEAEWNVKFAEYEKKYKRQS